MKVGKLESEKVEKYGEIKACTACLRPPARTGRQAFRLLISGLVEATKITG
jgi:hypothetical protein